MTQVTNGGTVTDRYKTGHPGKYPAEIREAVLDSLRKKTSTKTELIEKFGVSAATIENWQRAEREENEMNSVPGLQRHVAYLEAKLKLANERITKLKRIVLEDV